MTEADKHLAELDGASSAGRNPIARVALTAFAFAALQPLAMEVQAYEAMPTPIQCQQTANSASLMQQLPSDTNLAQQLLRVHDELLSDQVQLGALERQVLLENLWELYE